MAQSLEPQQVSEHVWYYEEGRKLTFVVESGYLERNTVADTVVFQVPLSMLEKSLARSPKKGKRGLK
jgi:hypothetical protein